jgi:virginiamycin B lyase
LNLGEKAMHDGRTMEARATPGTSRIVEFPLHWPGSGTPHGGPACHPTASGSTHELVYDRNGGRVFWVAGQNYDHIARVELDGNATFFAMPANSLPHGMTFDCQGQLWVTFEGTSEIARIDPDGSIADRIDVRIHAQGAAVPLDTRPHGLGAAPDGAVWFTGKLTNTVGRVAAGRVQHFELPTIGAVPIYVSASADGTIWCTELTGSRIARITPAGEVSEFAIPTASARPIAIVKAPDGNSMWFSEEAGGKVARIDPDGTITEFPVPLTQSDAILAGLAFDTEGNLWVQQYVAPPATGPTADDYIVKLGGLAEAAPGDLTGVSIEYLKAPSRGTVMHRIIQGPDGNIWFSELGLDRIGRVNL